MSGPVLRLLVLFLVLLQLIYLVEPKKRGKGLRACLAKNKQLKNRRRCLNKGQKKHARYFQRFGEKKKKQRSANDIGNNVMKKEGSHNNKEGQYNQRNSKKRFENQRKAGVPGMLQKKKKVECPRRGRMRRSGKGRKQRRAGTGQTKGTRKQTRMLGKGQRQNCVRKKLKGKKQKHGSKRRRRSRKKLGRRRGRQDSPRGSSNDPTCEQVFPDGSWGSWKECQTSCGITGIQRRHRWPAVHASPLPKGCYAWDTRECNRQKCASKKLTVTITPPHHRTIVC